MKDFLNGRRYFLSTEYDRDGRYKEVKVSPNLNTTMKK